MITALVNCSIFAQRTSEKETITNNTAFNKSTFIYGNNKSYDGSMISLDADLYKPNLFSNKLPLVIVYIGGGYASGDKNVANIRPFINAFTAANITAIAPNFRQGWNGSATKGLCESATPDYFNDAAYRAFQDNRALIRYCKANANSLGIDSNKIFLFGISSGGFLVMHHLYYDESLTTTERVARLGALDFQDNSFRNTTDVAGIISVVGGFYSNNSPIIKKTPLLLFNNTCDGAVDFFNGWLGNCSNTARTFGPGIFTKLLEQYNNPYSLHVFCGYNHGFQTEAAPNGNDALAIKYVSDKSVAFVKEILQETHQFSTQVASDSVASTPLNKCNNFETFYWCKEDSIEVGNNYFSLTPNPVTCLLQPKLNVRYPTDETFTILVVDESAKTISQKKAEYKTSQNIIYLDVNDFSAGINFLVVKNNSGKIIWKTKVMRYCEF
jgi:hypothetical protein